MLNQNENGGKHILLKYAMPNITGVTAEADDEIFTATAHGLVENDIVEFVSGTGGTGLTAGTRYFVIAANLTANTFQLSATKGGAAVNVTVDLSAGVLKPFKNVGGIRAKSMSVNSEMVDVTNQDSEEYRSILDQAGIRSMSLSGSGVFENGAVIKQILSDLLSNTIREAILVMSRDYDYMHACVKVTTMEESGEYNAESNYSISLESSGEITYAQA